MNEIPRLAVLPDVLMCSGDTCLKSVGNMRILSTYARERCRR